MTKVRTIMHKGVASVRLDDSVQSAAALMRDHNVGALPICDDNDYPVGIVTDRDIAISATACGWHPAITTVGELKKPVLHTVDADADLDDALAIMQRHRIRRLPVTENDMVVGMISEADIVRQLPHAAVMRFLDAICVELPKQQATTEKSPVAAALV